MRAYRASILRGKGQTAFIIVYGRMVNAVAIFEEDR